MKKCLLTLIVLGGLSDTGSFAQDVTDGLIGHWTFDENSGNIASGSSGLGRDAEFIGDPQWVSGFSGSALEFDGDDALFTPGWYGIEGFAGRTIMCWIKTTATNTHGILSWGLSSENGRKYHFRINNNEANGTFGAIRTEIQGTFNIGETIVNDDQWHQVVSTFPDDGVFVTEINHYVDGQFEETKSTNDNAEAIALDTAAGPEVSDQEFRIGMSMQSGSERFFPGVIDEVRVYDRELSLEEIQAVQAFVESNANTRVRDYMIY